MKQKNIVATLYLKDGHAVRSMTDFTPVDANVYRLCQLYNDSGVDKIIILTCLPAMMSMKRMSIRFETSIATLILKYAQEETLTVWKTSKTFVCGMPSGDFECF